MPVEVAMASGERGLVSFCHLQGLHRGFDVLQGKFGLLNVSIRQSPDQLVGEDLLRVVCVHFAAHALHREVAAG